MKLLNSRELAARIGAFILLIWALTRTDFRRGLTNVLKQAFAKPLWLKRLRDIKITPPRGSRMIADMRASHG